MPETIVTKCCCTCKRNKALSEFNKCCSGKFGHHNQCRDCTHILNKSEKGKAAVRRYQQSIKGKLTIRKYRQTEPVKKSRRIYQQSYGQTKKAIATRKQYNLLHPDRRAATKAVERAVRVGELARPDTLQCPCSKPASLYHHARYEPKHYLAVIAICCSCHRYIHLMG